MAVCAACQATIATFLHALVATTSLFTAVAKVRVSAASPSAATLDIEILILAALTTRVTRPVSCLTLAARPFLNATAMIPDAPFLVTKKCL